MTFYKHCPCKGSDQLVPHRPSTRLMHHSYPLGPLARLDRQVLFSADPVEAVQPSRALLIRPKVLHAVATILPTPRLCGCARTTQDDAIVSTTLKLTGFASQITRLTGLISPLTCSCLVIRLGDVHLEVLALPLTSWKFVEIIIVNRIMGVRG